MRRLILAQSKGVSFGRFKRLTPEDVAENRKPEIYRLSPQPNHFLRSGQLLLALL